MLMYLYLAMHNCKYSISINKGIHPTAKYNKANQYIRINADIRFGVETLKPVLPQVIKVNYNAQVVKISIRYTLF